MLDDIPLQVEMPLGVSATGDFTPFQNAFRLEGRYGLRAGAGPEPVFSPTLQISTPAADPAARVHAIIRGRVRFVPATATASAQMELQPLPFEQALLGQRLHGSVSPNLIVYRNIDPVSVGDAVDALLAAAQVEASAHAGQRQEFLAGTRWLTVSAGNVIGRPAVDAAGRRRLDLAMLDHQDFYLNPTHYLFLLPVLRESLASHPLLTLLRPQQHRQLLATKGQLRFVQQNSPNPAPPYTTAATAAHTITDVLAQATAGDLIVILDDATYQEALIAIPSGVALTSTAILNIPGRIPEQPNLPTPPAPPGATILVQNVGNVHISGVNISGGTDQGGIRIEDCFNVEVAQCDIHHNSAVRGGGIGIIRSTRVNCWGNAIRDNQVSDGAMLFQWGQGGGIYVEESQFVTMAENAVYRNVATNFGGGIAVADSLYVRIFDNEIGGFFAADGNRVTGDQLPLPIRISTANPQGGGGGIGVYDTDIQIIGNRIRNNEAHNGGGIELFFNGSGYVARNDIIDNQARPETPDIGGGDGGGVAVNQISINLETADLHRPTLLHDNLIEGNVAGDDGGGVYGTAKAIYKIYGANHRILDNSARNNGGGVRCTFGSQVHIDGGEIRGNHANLNRNSNPPEDARGGGGGIAVRNTDLLLENCVLETNDVNDFGGGSVYVVTTDEGSLILSFREILENAFRFDRADIRINNCTLRQNAANGPRGAGGGLYVVYDLYDVHLHITNTTLSPNIAMHNDPNKAYNVLIQDVSGIALDRIDNDTELPPLTPLNNFERTYSP
jgi:hypothetical protein